MLAFRGRILKPISKEEIADFKDGLLVVGDDGKVFYCGIYNQNKLNGLKPKKVHLIIPSFVDCHVHLPQITKRAKYGLTLLDWLKNNIYPAEEAFGNVDLASKISTMFFNELIANGTTMAGVLLSVHRDSSDVAFDIARKSKLRILMGKAMMDMNCPDSLKETTKESLENSVSLCLKWNGVNDGKIRYAFYPRFALTCSEKMWFEIGKCVEKYNAFIHTHCAETRAECEEFKIFFPAQKDYLSLFESTGCLGKKTLLAHGVCLSSNEYGRISKAGASVIHCPSSNLFLKSGQFPIEYVENSNVKTGLASDVAGGPDLSMFNVLKDAVYSQNNRFVKLQKLFYYSTAGGAETLGWNGYNQLKEGVSADFLLINLNKLDKNIDWNEESTDDILSNLVFRGSSHIIKSVYMDGVEINS